MNNLRRLILVSIILTAFALSGCGCTFTLDVSRPDMGMSVKRTPLTGVKENMERRVDVVKYEFGHLFGADDDAVLLTETPAPPIAAMVGPDL